MVSIIIFDHFSEPLTLRFIEAPPLPVLCGRSIIKQDFLVEDLSEYSEAELFGFLYPRIFSGEIRTFSFEQAVEVIKEGSGAHFDPKIVEAFLTVAEDFWAESMKAAV